MRKRIKPLSHRSLPAFQLVKYANSVTRKLQCFLFLIIHLEVLQNHCESKADRRQKMSDGSKDAHQNIKVGRLTCNEAIEEDVSQ